MPHAITPTDHRIAPSCVECQHPIPREMFPVTGLPETIRCTGCGIRLRVRRWDAPRWSVQRADAGQSVAPLQLVASPRVRADFHDACRAIATRLRGTQGVEPGMAAIEEVD
jgi:hypothetical protein